MTDHQHAGNTRTSSISYKNSPHKPKEHKSHKKVLSKLDKTTE
ncbi:hypothetical protein [Clostridium ganghwense]|uniref:Uncharacterized protein n=1 Tax=Clostridium ganghwense TaxID=312089 RepID=A0ABT4CU09_9CLOT|nr:hypothetical protein [Clostridium ganghwense]MCY6372560.1 hypothetical protein [Clostridium ganghwense]